VLAALIARLPRIIATMAMMREVVRAEVMVRVMVRVMVKGQYHIPDSTASSFTAFAAAASASGSALALPALRAERR
jgi:hypothetical protein